MFHDLLTEWRQPRISWSRATLANIKHLAANKRRLSLMNYSRQVPSFTKDTHLFKYLSKVLISAGEVPRRRSRSHMETILPSCDELPTGLRPRGASLFYNQRTIRYLKPRTMHNLCYPSHNRPNPVSMATLSEMNLCNRLHFPALPQFDTPTWRCRRCSSIAKCKFMLHLSDQRSKRHTKKTAKEIDEIPNAELPLTQ